MMLPIVMKTHVGRHLQGCSGGREWFLENAKKALLLQGREFSLPLVL